MAEELFDFKDWFQFRGALSRKAYTVRFLCAFFGGIIIGMIPILGWAISLVAMVVSIFAVKRRLQSLGHNPWWTLLLLVPVVNLVVVIALMIRNH